MCGRYRLSRRKKIIEEYFDAVSDSYDWKPRYNVAPTQPVLVVRQHPTEPVRHLSEMRWGLIPSWSKDASAAARMINARSETAHILPAFRDAIRHRRCLVAADAFYEWKRSASTKQPYCFEVNEGELFAFAGLWEAWKEPNGAWLKTCCILTTTPNTVTSAVHDRMPVILDSTNYDLWLDPRLKDSTVVHELLKPFDAGAMSCYPVSSRVNNAQNDDEECTRPIKLDIQDQQPQLFP
jgi:putative SOS response-associated peptidase YedK